MFTRKDLAEVVIAECKRIEETFTYKNGSYGQDKDAFYNFHEAARDELGDDSFNGMYKALRIYVKKHDAALKNKGLDDPEAIERLRDIAVYSLIAIGMKTAMERNDNA